MQNGLLFLEAAISSAYFEYTAIYWQGFFSLFEENLSKLTDALSPYGPCVTIWDIFCTVDEFYKEFDRQIDKKSLMSSDGKYNWCERCER